MNDDMNDIAIALTQSMAITGVSTMTGQTVLWAGTASTPSMIFSADTGTGFFLSSANTWGFSASLVQIFTIGANGIAMTSGHGGNFVDKNGNNCFALPVGVIAPFAGGTVPNGWTLCYGQAVSRSGFAALFAAISINFGTGDGSTTFNLPDMRGRVAVTQDNLGGVAANRVTNASTNGIDGSALANVGGLQTGVITIATLPVANLSNTLTITSVYGGSTVYSTSTTLADPTAFTPALHSWSASTTVTASWGGSVGFAGNDTPFNAVQPTIVMNYIIYHGVYA